MNDNSTRFYIDGQWSIPWACGPPPGQNATLKILLPDELTITCV
jgi:hypothetical protein